MTPDIALDVSHQMLVALKGERVVIVAQALNDSLPLEVTAEDLWKAAEAVVKALESGHR